MSRSLSLVSVLLLLGSGSLFAATLKVPQQFTTIQAAVDAAAAGDVIQIAKGVYDENVVIFKSELTVIGKKGAIIDGGGFGPAITVGFGEAVVVRNLAVRNTTEPGILIGLSIDVELSGCTVTDVFGDGITVQDAQNARIVDNRVIRTGMDGIRIESDYVLVSGNRVVEPSLAGIRVLGHLNTIEDNTVEAPGLAGVLVGDPAMTLSGYNLVVGNRLVNSYAALAADGVRMLHAPNTWIIDNTVVHTNNHGILDDGLCAGSVIDRNHVTNCDQSGIQISTPGMELSHNVIKGCGMNGIHLIGAAGTNAYSNRATGCGNTGFTLSSIGSVLTKNSAKGNGIADLADLGSDNVYIDNVFPVVQ